MKFFSFTLAVLFSAPFATLAAEESSSRPSGPVNASYLNALPLSAIVDSLSLEKLANLVVTDSKFAQPQERVTQKIEVLNAAEFDQQALPNRNLAELLSTTSGQFVNVLSRNDANWGSYAGLGPKYNTWLLDGVPIDSFVDGMSLPLWAMERVEVHKGPASVLYSNYLTMDFAGNEAPLAGTTNFILKDRIETAETRFLVGVGSYNTARGQVYHQNRQGDFSYFLGAGYEKSAYTNYGSTNSWLNILNSPDYRKDQLYAKLAYRFDRDDHNISVFVNHTDHQGDVGRPNRDFRFRYDTLNFAYNNQLSETFHLQAKIGYRDYNRRWGEDNFPVSLALRQHDGVRQHILLGDLTLSWQHTPDALLTMGADSQKANFRTDAEIGPRYVTSNAVVAYSHGIFIQEKINFDKWTLRAGGRYNTTLHDYSILESMAPERPSNHWSKSLWSFGVRYNATSTFALFGNTGNSFVAPSANQMGGTLRASDAGIPGRNGRLPNLGLSPENGTGSDIGLDLRPRPGLGITLRGFYNKINDAIIDTVVSSIPSQSQAQNIGSSTSRGIELSAKHIVSDSFQWFVNMTLTRSRIANLQNPDENGSSVPFAPDRMVNAGFTVLLPGETTVSSYLRWVGRYYDSTAKSSRIQYGTYETLNVKMQKTLERNARYALTLAVELNNLTNRRPDLPFGFRDPGFNAFTSLQLTY